MLDRQAGIAQGLIDDHQAIYGITVKKTHLLAVEMLQCIETFQLRCNTTFEFGCIEARYRASATYSGDQRPPQFVNIVSNGGQRPETRNNNSFQLHPGLFEVDTSFSNRTLKHPSSGVLQRSGERSVTSCCSR